MSLMDIRKYIVTNHERLSQRVRHAWQIRRRQVNKQNELTRRPPKRSGKTDDQAVDLLIDIYYT